VVLLGRGHVSRGREKIASLSSDTDSNPKVARLSSYKDGTAGPATPPLGAPDGWPTSDVVEALYAVLQAMPELRVAIARRLELNPSEVDAMEHVMGDPIGPVELSRRLHMTSASATVLVDRLEEAGHVVREPDPADGRRRVVRPTPAGEQAVYAQIGPLVADLVDAAAGLTARERTAVTRYLSRVLHVLEEHAREA
jgi:DNA-binding MarR family transcriptional regulator